MNDETLPVQYMMSDETNLADDKEFATTLASLEGVVPTSQHDSVVGEVVCHRFYYSKCITGDTSVATNAIYDGGDSGHGFETNLDLSFDEGADVAFAVGVDEDGNPNERELVVRAGGCDEALALARLLEAAAVSLRTQIAKNSQNASTFAPTSFTISDKSS